MGPADDAASAIASALAAEPAAQKLLLMVDQFEELFSQVKDAATRDGFIARLKALRDDSRCTVILTMRTDFYGDLMNSALWPIDKSQVVEVAALRGEALRQAIVKPAEAAGFYLEEVLVERLLADAANEPGSLPMLQEALVLLWGTMKGRLLTRASYDTLGRDGRSGLAVAMATKADATLAALPPDRQRMARRIFLRLVQFGEGRPDTRRQLGVDDLRAESDDRADFDALLQHLIANRLLTPSPDEARGLRVDIAHEMLIVGWPTSRDWVESRRNAEKTRRRLVAKAEEWVRLGRGESGLLDPAELAEADGWLKGPDAMDLGIDSDVSTLADASRRAIDSQKRGKRRRTQMAIGALTSALLAISALGILVEFKRRNAEAQRLEAVNQRKKADDLRVVADKERNEAIVQKKAAEEAKVDAIDRRKDAERQARVSSARQLATQSWAEAKTPSRAVLLAAEAVFTTRRAGDPVEPAAEQALHWALGLAGGTPLLDFMAVERSRSELKLSPDGRHVLIKSGYDRPYRLRLVRIDGERASDVALNGLDKLKYRSDCVEFSRDGSFLAISSGEAINRHILVWDVDRADDPPAHLMEPRGIFMDNRIVWEPGSRRLAALVHATQDSGGNNVEVLVWNLAGRDEVPPVRLRRPGADVLSVAFSGDGRRVATADSSGVLAVWDLDAPDEPICRWEKSIDPAEFSRGIFRVNEPFGMSHSGRKVLLTGFREFTGREGFPPTPLRVYDVEKPDAEPVILCGLSKTPLWAGGEVRAYLHPDGRRILACESRTKEAEPGAGPPETEYRLLMWDLDDLDQPPKDCGVGGSRGGMFSSDGHYYATSGARTATSTGPYVVEVWSLSGPDPYRFQLKLDAPAEPAAFSADGKHLMVKTSTYARIWDLSDLSSGPVRLRGWDLPPRSAVFIRGTSKVATLSDDTIPVRVWDLRRPITSPRQISDRSNQIRATSADGHRLIVEKHGPPGGLLIWDLDGDGIKITPLLDSIDLNRERSFIDELKYGQRAISHDARYFSVRSVDAIRIWDLDRPTELPRILNRPKTRFMTHLMGGRLFAIDDDGSGFIWDPSREQDATTPFPLPGYQAPEIWSPGQETLWASDNGRWLVSSGLSQQTLCWDLKRPGIEPNVLVRDASDGRVLATGGGHWLLMSVGPNNKTPYRLRHLGDEVSDPMELAGSEGSEIDEAVFSPDGHQVALVCPGPVVKVWKVERPDVVSAVLRGHQGSIRSIRFTPDGRKLLAVAKDGTGRSWNLTGGDAEPIVLTMNALFDSSDWRLSPLEGEATPIGEVYPTPAGRALTVDHSGTSILLWDLELDELLRQAEQTTGRNLTLDEWRRFFPGLPYRPSFPDQTAPQFDEAEKDIARNLTLDEWQAAFPGLPYRPTFPNLSYPKK